MGNQMLSRLMLVVLVVISCLGGSSNASGSDGKVLLEFYSESLCPYCANFAVNYLSKFFQNGLIDIVELRVIPYGNARIYGGGDIVCQHGEDECKLNIIQSCAIHHYPDVTQWFPFFFCLEKLATDLPRNAVFKNWKTCVDTSYVDLDTINSCFEGPLGDKLVRGNGAETDSLDPPHKYVPWVVVNGTPLYDEYEDVEKAVCQAYKGPLSKPTTCNRIGSASKTLKAGVCTKGLERVGDGSQAERAQYE
ncbi:hypothetical protein R1sor_008565 [Riccia sorocarpa]|uniref:Gamma-interferon-inducible lysosomal thiol reductase n=1 Tax=Riccia sorocarpa TaxID=122646 RepID=A0ABD3HVX8_9MARC